MALFDRLTATDESTVKIPVHGFASALRELARGVITKAQVVSAFGLDVGEETELDSIIATYQALGTQAEKDAFTVKMHDVFILSEEGFYNETKAKSELGF